jgi:hypothetical protein
VNVADVTFGADGVIVQMRRSKTNQEGEGRKVGLPFGSHPLTCPVRLLRAWLNLATISSGPIFRAVDRQGNVADNRLIDQSVALVVKRCAKAAGPELEIRGALAAIGHATAGGDGRGLGRSWPRLGIKSLPMVRRYIRVR